MKKIEAVIFDWAGTTIDFGSFAPVQAFIDAFNEYDIYPTVEEIRQPMGLAKRDHIKTVLEMKRINDEWLIENQREWTESDIDKIYKRSEELLLSNLKDYAQPKPFVLETVTELRQRGIKIGSTTGYNHEMMSIVVPEANKQGYSPDIWFSPESVGRPYPFMIFENMKQLKISSVRAVIKVGDTIADIQEGKNAGVISVGVIEGSSLMGLSLSDYEKLSEQQRQIEASRVQKIYEENGADYIISNMSGLIELIDKITV